MAAQPEVAHNMPDMRDLRHSETYVITEADVAFTQRSGGVKTLATARLAELVERACVACVAPSVEDGYSTAGSAVVLRHTAPMPVGASIRIAVSVTHCLRRQLSFGFEVLDAANALLVVASGTHQRVYLRGDAFDAALRRKAGETGIRVGLTGTSAHFVDVAHTAGAAGGRRQGSGREEALSTSSLMTWAEEAAIAALEEHLPAGFTTVGGETALAHVAPTPKGMQVTCRAVLARVTTTRRGALRLLFELQGEDRVGSVMTGTHLRFLVQRAEFETRAKGVALPDGRRRGSFAGAVPLQDLSLQDVLMPPPSRPAVADAADSPARPPRPPPAALGSPVPIDAAQAAARAASATAAPSRTAQQQRPAAVMRAPPPAASGLAMGAVLPRVTPVASAADFLF